MSVDGTVTRLEIVENGGIEELYQMFLGSIKKENGFIVVYSLEYRSSFMDAKRRCSDILKIQNRVNVPIIICANFSDTQDKRRVITRREGEELAVIFNAKYFETSARLNTGITETFSEMVRMLREMVPVETKQNIETEQTSEKKNCIVY
ncbi:small GTP-binding protein [Histomonas meleagridis]|uniref:small GTP-binding protein n=1 Tax=Histomonas meleagridis TaxID=135588 RepID=UPI00355978A0|nr:small GTP-binding protein [Histomonas meleagridis]KAH0799871.1 small GTP-binding protein [Histomonas meleagridis]